jgi:signal transduction histidine kinase
MFRRGKPTAESEDLEMATQAARGRFLIEESREIVLVLDANRRVLSASRRAREALGLGEGSELPAGLLAQEDGRAPVIVPYTVGGREETLVYLGVPGDQAAYEELRAGFTAAVSHELRTPLARLMALLESAELPSADTTALISAARAEVEVARELIDDVLFLSELETGREVVSLGRTPALSVMREVVDEYAERADRAGLTISVDGDEAAEVPVRPRLLRVVVANLVENAIRYAGEGARLRLGASLEDGRVVFVAADDGAGIEEQDLSRLFERFYRADQARTSRGTGLGLAIVKHVVVAAGGEVEARGGRGRGLEIRCSFPAAA